MIFTGILTTPRASLQLIVLSSMLIYTFLITANAAAVIKQESTPLKECQPFKCLRFRAGLDKKCEIRTETNTKQTTCRKLMEGVCRKVEENDRKFMKECHGGLHRKGNNCAKCEVASRICRNVFDTILNNYQFVSARIDTMLHEEVREMNKFHFTYRGIGK